MGEEFRADPERLRAKVPAFQQLGAEVEALVQRLHDLVSSDAAPWGTDDSGKAFADTFAPEEQRTLSDLNSLTEVIRQTGPDLQQVAANFEQQDLHSAQVLRNTESEIRTGPDPMTVNPVPFGGLASNVSASAPVSPVSVPTGAAGKDTVARTPGQVPGAPSPEAGAAGRPPLGESAPAAGGDDPSSGTQQQRSPEQPQQRSDPGVRDGQRVEPTAVTASPITTPAQTTTGAGPTAPTPSRIGPAAAPDVTRPARTGSAASAGSPWSKTTSGGAPRVSAAASGPTDTPPRIPGGPPNRPAEKPAEPERRVGEGTVEPIAVRLTRELAERHGVRAFGFDTPGVPPEVLMEMVAAVNDVLPRHPAITLSAIGIADLPGSAATRLDLEPADPGPRDTSPDTVAGGIARITLSVRSAVEPAELERAVRSDEDAGVLAPGCAQRPVYSTVVRELGRVLDAAGGFRARTATRHALVAAYLPLASPENTDSLARTVSGFREWRAQLSGAFRGGRFDPEAALAEAFTEVVLDVARASLPARALHRLLVETAGSRRTGSGDTAT
ncbi:WXG100 family type VII secretion target [Nocardia sp. NBC_01329]|uniref:WXG100 family type VII secretion target n=1 Tax=Nocardia sp. NBC_01329 TaxID=2903594 RepID=UPI002E11AFB5|nr:hypothetical protein OG405_16920 [Nocardia sp. NBC_01329]